MGVGYNTGLVETNVSNGFNFEKGNKKNKYMIKFMQTFYTVDVDQGKDTFLYDKFDISDFKGYRPVYVSSIAYGRLAYLTIESEETWDKIKNDLSVAVAIKTGTDIKGDISTAVNNVKKAGKMNITIIGSTNVVTNLEGFLDELAKGGFSKSNPGQIVAYKLRFVDDNSIANTIYNDEYTVTKTVEQMGKGIDTTFTLYRIRTNANDGAGKAMELFGNLEIADDITKNRNSLWSYSKSSPQKVKEKDDNIKLNSSVTFRVPNENAKFDLYLNLSEKDDTNADRFTDASGQIEGNTAKTIMLNSVEDGKDIIIKSYAIGKKRNKIDSEWIEYYIRVNKKYQY
jgi:thiol-activated cytolysin